MEKLFEFLLMVVRFVMFLKLIVMAVLAIPFALVKHFRMFGFFEGLKRIDLPFRVLWKTFCMMFDRHIQP